MSRKLLFRFPQSSCRLFIKNASAAAKVHVKLNEAVQKDIENNTIKPRKHPGIIKTATVQLPDEVKNAMKTICGDTPIKQLINDSGPLSRFLHSRQPPIEEEDLLKKRSVIMQEVQKELGVNIEGMSDEEVQHYNKIVKSKVERILKQRVYHWNPLDYSRHMGLVYMITRAAPQYAVMKRIFKELSVKDKDFSPETLFDFGSGIGTVTWAAKDIWNESLKEYFCVDSSSHMNDLSKEVLDIYDQKVSERTFFRQFLPSSLERKYDIVISSYSLLELPSLRTRLQTLSNLWNKTEQYLVLAEYGTMAGFKMLTEARNFLLKHSIDEDGRRDLHIAAPCPHDVQCPRVKADRTPCNFEVPFFTFPQKEVVKTELYSYLIIKRGERSENDPCWPRIVRPVLNRSRHTICRMCTAKGNLQEIIFTPTKHDKIVYKCAKSSKWGDILPFSIGEPQKFPEEPI